MNSIIEYLFCAVTLLDLFFIILGLDRIYQVLLDIRRQVTPAELLNEVEYDSIQEE